MLKGAIFDLDGTLLDSMQMWNNFAEKYLEILLEKETHRTFPSQDAPAAQENLSELFRTFTMEQAAVYYQTHYDIGLSAEEIISGANRMLEKYYFDEVKLKQGADAFVRKLDSCGVKLCLATVTDRRLADAALKRLGLRHFFKDIFTASEIGCDKTSPIIYRKAQSCLGTDKSGTIVFEDSYYAAKTAKADGFPVAAVMDSSESQQKDLRLLADCFIEDFEHTEQFWDFFDGI